MLHPVCTYIIHMVGTYTDANAMSREFRRSRDGNKKSYHTTTMRYIITLHIILRIGMSLHIYCI